MFRQCSRCNSEARPRARFCDQCGTELPERLPPSPESRPGTVLFCDMVKSVQLAHRLDPDDYQQVQQRMYRLMVDIARHHRGYVNRFVGDGALVLFGFPAALEDSAETAVRAGLDAVRSIAAVPVPSGDPLEMHVGIASGMVVMGGWTEGAMVDEVTVTGPVVNRAARLASAAAPGTVLLCDATRRLVGQRFELAALGPLQLAGEPASVTAWKALAEAERLSRFDARHDPSDFVVLVGRSSPLAMLRQCWLDTVAGQGRMVLLSGDAGIGKSRLTRAMQESLAGGSGLHLDLHCMPRAQNAPLYPVGVLLRRLADVRPDDDEDTALRKARALIGLALEAPAAEDALRHLRELVWPRGARQPADDSAELERDRTIGVILEWLQALAAQQPLLLVVEDLQWIDATTALVLRRIVEAVGTHRMFVVTTSRHEGEAMVAGLEGVLTQHLSPLDDAEAMHMVQRLAGADGLSAEVARMIVARADGNPLFIEELTRAAIEASDSPPSTAVPTSLQNVIQARLDRLPALRPLVQAAAVLGRDFAPRLLERLCPPEASGGLAEPVRQLVEHGILVSASPAGDAVLRFRHALIHDAVYQTLLRSDRQRLHRQAAGLMEDERERNGAGTGPPDLLAHHWAQAGEPERAVPHLLEASSSTALRAAYVESIGHVQAGLRLVEQIGDTALARRLRRALLAQQGHSSTATQGYAASAVEEAFASAMELCDDLTHPEELYPIVRGLGSYYLVRGRTGRADALARQCVQLAELAGRVDLQIDALAFAAYPAYYCGRLDDSQRDLDRSLALYRDAGGGGFNYPNVQEPATAAWSLLTTVAWLRGNLPASERAAEALLAHLRQLQRPFDDTFGLVWLAATRLLQRRFADAAAQAQAGLEVAKARGFGTWLPAAAMQLYIAHGALGAAPEAAALLQQVHQGFVGAGAEVSYPYYCWGIALALEQAGQPAAALETAERGLARALAGEETYMGGELHIALARLYAADAARSRAHLRAAYEHACTQGAQTVALRAVAMLAAAAGADPAQAALAQDCLAVLDGRAPVPKDPSFVSRSLATLAASDQSVLQPHADAAAAHVPVAAA